jgi:DNA-binding response OmpR family regulator
MRGTQALADRLGPEVGVIGPDGLSGPEPVPLETENANECRTQAAMQRGQANHEMLPKVEAQLHESARCWDALANAYELIPGGASSAPKPSSGYTPPKAKPLNDADLIGRAALSPSLRNKEPQRRAGRLTDMEQQVLDLLVVNAGSIVPRASIMSHLYGEVSSVDPKIVDVVICRVRNKLAARAPNTASIVTVRSRGYALTGPAASAG